MFTNWLNRGLLWQAWVEKIDHRVETHRFSLKEKIPGPVVSKEGHTADSLMGPERTHHYWFPWKRYNCKQYFLKPIPLAKFTLYT